MVHLLRRLGHRLNERVPAAALAVVAGVVFVTSVLGVALIDRPKTGGEPSSSTAATQRPGIAGFDAIGFTVTQNGETRPACALLAETPQQQATGLMRQTDLGGYDAMVFRFAAASRAEFYMANVPVPLEIAWFDEGGRLLDREEMSPCSTSPNECPKYGPDQPYRLAVEVFVGGLDRLGLVSGSQITIGGTCS